MSEREESLINTLASIFKALDEIEYECEARSYTLDEDNIAALFFCRDLAWLAIKDLKKDIIK